MKIMGLKILLRRETTGLNLSQYSMPDTQIPISVRMSIGNKSNNYACEGLSSFLRKCRLLVRLCVLRGNENNSRGYLLLSTLPHNIFVIKSCGVVTFSEV